MWLANIALDAFWKSPEELDEVNLHPNHNNLFIFHSSSVFLFFFVSFFIIFAF